jgi:hypothetical protein
MGLRNKILNLPKTNKARTGGGGRDGPAAQSRKWTRHSNGKLDYACGQAHSYQAASLDIHEMPLGTAGDPKARASSIMFSKSENLDGFTLRHNAQRRPGVPIPRTYRPDSWRLWALT